MRIEQELLYKIHPSRLFKTSLGKNFVNSKTDLEAKYIANVCAYHRWQVGSQLLQTVEENLAKVCSPARVDNVLSKRHSSAVLYSAKQQAYRVYTQVLKCFCTGDVCHT